jgi:hypothetical protein
MFRARPASSASEVDPDGRPVEVPRRQRGVKVAAWERSGKAPSCWCALFSSS